MGASATPGAIMFLYDTAASTTMIWPCHAGGHRLGSCAQQETWFKMPLKSVQHNGGLER